MNLLKIAWRNLWRNKRRTTITSASILFAVFFSVVMRSYQLGFYNHMVKNAIESFSGFLQIQHVDYQNDPSLDNTIICTDSLIQALEQTNGVKAVVPRVETFALASTGVQTKGTLIIGIDPEKEHKLSNPEHMLVRYRINKEGIQSLKSNPLIPEEIKPLLDDLTNNSYANTGTLAMELGLDEKKDKKILDEFAAVSKFPGNYLSQNDNGVLVSDRLSKYLKLSVGDTLILLGQGYHGGTAAGLYPVRGIIRLANPELDNKLVYMSIHEAQIFSGLENRVNTLAINLIDNSDENIAPMQTLIGSKLNDKNMTVRNWKEFNKVLQQQIESDNQSGKIFLVFLYVIIFFGIFGTVLMMIHERKREMGVLVSIGMQKIRLAVIMIYEMFFMGIIGLILGILLSSPIIYYYHIHPIRLVGDMAQVMEDMGFDPVMPLAWFDTYVFWQVFAVSIMVLIVSIYPIYKSMKLKEVEALRA